MNTLIDEVVEGGTLCACKIFEIQSELTRENLVSENLVSHLRNPAHLAK